MHIFFVKQIESEIIGVLQMIERVYSMFKLPFSAVVSTRPKEFIGDLELWNRAESILKQVVETKFNVCNIDEEGGAFYGPKIDITIEDAQGRKHQCATIQLDFQLPERFKLAYIDKECKRVQPVMIHRAVLGSIERFMAILLEHTQGNLPFWLSPRQIYIVPISKEFNEYCQRVFQKFNRKYQVVYDDNDDHFKSKIGFAESFKWNLILIVGKREVETLTVNVRSSHKVIGSYSIDYIYNQLKQTCRTFVEPKF